MKTYDITKFKVYPWWKHGKKALDYILVCYTDKQLDMYDFAEKLREEENLHIKVNPKKWFAQVTYHEDPKDKHLKGYALFCKKSITNPVVVAHEIVHVTQFYFGYTCFPLCNTLQGQNHELIAHSHSFMMKRIMDFAKKIK